MTARTGDDVQILSDAHHSDERIRHPIPMHLEPGQLLGLLPGIGAHRHGKIGPHHFVRPVFGGEQVPPPRRRR